MTDQLPVSVRLHPCEPVHSLVTRISRANGIIRSDFQHHYLPVGFPLTIDPSFLSDGHTETLASVLGTTAEVLSSFLPDVGSAFESRPRELADGGSQLRTCQDCLIERGGALDVRWEFPWVQACVRHNRPVVVEPDVDQGDQGDPLMQVLWQLQEHIPLAIHYATQEASRTTIHDRTVVDRRLRLLFSNVMVTAISIQRMWPHPMTRMSPDAEYLWERVLSTSRSSPAFAPLATAPLSQHEVSEIVACIDREEAGLANNSGDSLGPAPGNHSL